MKTDIVDRLRAPLAGWSLNALSAASCYVSAQLLEDAARDAEKARALLAELVSTEPWEGTDDGLLICHFCGSIMDEERADHASDCAYAATVEFLGIAS